MISNANAVLNNAKQSYANTNLGLHEAMLVLISAHTKAKCNHLRILYILLRILLTVVDYFFNSQRMSTEYARGHGSHLPSYLHICLHNPFTFVYHEHCAIL